MEIACIPCACIGSSPLSILGLNRCCGANTTRLSSVELCGPCCTSPDTEGHIRIMVSQLYRNLSVVEGISTFPVFCLSPCYTATFSANYIINLYISRSAFSCATRIGTYSKFSFFTRTFWITRAVRPLILFYSA